MSVVALAVALGATVAMFRLEVAPIWRLLVFIPFFFAASGALQGLLRTCPMHSLHGTRECEDGSALPLGDERRRKASRRLAKRVWGGSVLLAAFSTTLVFFLP